MRVKYKGTVYSSRRALAEELKIDIDVLNMRIYRGMTLAQAIKYKPPTSLKFQGKEYKSKRQLAKSFGLTFGQLDYRMKKTNGNLKKALSYKPREYAVTYKGKKYSSLRDLCRREGANYQSVRRRILVKGESVDKAIAG